MSIMSGRWFAFLLLAGAAVLPAYGADEDEPFQWEFVTGRFQFIGRYPDSQRTYTGTAQIERVERQLRLTRNVAGKKTRIYGVVRRADPGEAYVLAFKWKQLAAMDMVCVIGSDLDNYPGQSHECQCRGPLK